METIAVSEKETKSTLMNPMVFILFLLVIFLTVRTVYQVKRKGKTVGGALKDDAKLLATPTAVVAILGFVTGLVEFIVTDNVNQYGFPDSITKGKLFALPDKKYLITTSVTLAVASVITGILTDLALRQLPSYGKNESGYYMG
jgi:heme/copper-type cytochrome/quinol oxidase subunit 2